MKEMSDDVDCRLFKDACVGKRVPIGLVQSQKITKAIGLSRIHLLDQV